MSTLEKLALPNGKVIEVPSEASASDVREYAISQGFATTSEWDQWNPEDKPFTEVAGQWVKRNMDIPAGLTGAVAGFYAGSPAGPYGQAAGTVIGGASGTFGGSLLSDHLQGNELDYSDAMNDALWSAGIDITTLGLGKIASPLAKSVKSWRREGKSPQQAAQEVLQAAKEGGSVGSPESLQATQRYLLEHGATLTPFQTGEATGVMLFNQQVGELGILSRGMSEANAMRVNDAVNNSFQQLVKQSGNTIGLDPSTFGNNVSEIIFSAKSHLNKQYDQGITKIKDKARVRAVPTSPIVKGLESYMRQHSTQAGSSLAPSTLKLINEITGSLGQTNLLGGQALIEHVKKFNNTINGMGDFGKQVSPDVNSVELAKVSKILREGMYDSFRVANPKIAADLATLNSAFSSGVKNLFPKVTKEFLTRAEKGNFKNIGTLLLKAGNLDQAREVYKSIDSAFSILGRDTATFAFKNAKEVKDSVRNGYLQTTLGLGNAFDMNKFTHLARQFESPEKAAQLAYIMGDNYKGVKQLFNVMEEATASPKSSLFSLALRSREMQGAAAVGTAGIQLATTGAITSTALAAGSAVLLAPIVLAKAAMNPKKMARLVAFGKKDFESHSSMMLAASNLAMDITKEMSDDEKQDLELWLANYMEGEN